MELYEILLKAHSGLRWLLLLLVVVTIIKLIMTWLGGGAYGKGDRILSKATVGMMDVMFLIGASMLVSVWVQVGEPIGFHLEHGVINLVAIAIAHVAGKGKGATDPMRARNGAILFLVSLGLIILAILRLPQGFTMT